MMPPPSALPPWLLPGPTAAAGLQDLALLLILCWAGWQTFSHLLPRRQRRVRGWLARHGQNWLPAALVRWIRPEFPATGCGCGTTTGGCAGVAQSTGAPPSAKK